MNDFIRRSAEKPTNPHPVSAAVQMRVCVCVYGEGGGGLDHDERLTIYDLSSVKQRFAQLTTFKCHPTAKSAYQRQVLHGNEEVLWRSRFPPSSTKWDFPPPPFFSFARKKM